MVEAMGRQFLGLGCAGMPPQLVARFAVMPGKECYYMTLKELCDWIEYQMSSGFYYTARPTIAVDRAALMALITAQRSVLAGRKDASDYPATGAEERSFADYAATANGEVMFVAEYGA